MSKYTYEVDTLNGEAIIYNEAGERIDTVDCWDLLNVFENAASDRAAACIEQNKNSYDGGFKEDRGE